jgi:hypothetical protein
MMLVVPRSAIVEHPKMRFLEVGRAGADGILFGYRCNLPGIWSYYPVEQQFARVANSIDELVVGWLAGEISV